MSSRSFLLLRAILFGALLSSGDVTPPPVSAQDGLKVYISADMEGVTGVVTGDHLGPTGFEYQQAREWLTDEVNAAIRAAQSAGATEIVVSDSHGNGENILLDRIPRGVKLVRSWPRPLSMMQGIDESFDAVLFIGYHASTTNPEGVRAHTMSSGTLTGVRLNGLHASEAMINAAIAGHFGVPVVMISGDDAIVSEAAEQIGDLEGAVLKWNYGFHSAMTVTPEEGQEIIAEKVTAALGRLADFEPHRVEGPIDVEVSFKNYLAAELLAYLPIVDRVDSHTISFTGKDMVEVSKFFSFITRYRPDITP
ncbi:MAG: M55 family metallopeptidase [Gemmatimonadetes bacterium]|nr:M55 family metallopeptidase [Gemmatimonadota bacterium]